MAVPVIGDAIAFPGYDREVVEALVEILRVEVRLGIDVGLQVTQLLGAPKLEHVWLPDANHIRESPRRCQGEHLGGEVLGHLVDGDNDVGVQVVERLDLQYSPVLRRPVIHHGNLHLWRRRRRARGFGRDLGGCLGRRWGWGFLGRLRASCQDSASRKGQYAAQDCTSADQLDFLASSHQNILLILCPGFDVGIDVGCSSSRPG